jgi:hypothetical protein
MRGIDTLTHDSGRAQRHPGPACFREGSRKATGKAQRVDCVDVDWPEQPDLDLDLPQLSFHQRAHLLLPQTTSPTRILRPHLSTYHTKRSTSIVGRKLLSCGHSLVLRRPIAYARDRRVHNNKRAPPRRLPSHPNALPCAAPATLPATNCAQPCYHWVNCAQLRPGRNESPASCRRMLSRALPWHFNLAGASALGADC